MSQPLALFSNESVRKLVEKTWCSVLKLESIDSTCSYFELGGTSLNAARMLGEICRQMHLTINFRTFYAHPYLDTLVELIIEEKTCAPMKISSRLK